MSKAFASLRNGQTPFTNIAINKMQDLNNISEWQSSLGLLPIKLFSNNESDNDFILLNGGKGDFCLQTEAEEKDSEYYFSSAWSSNTKNYVAVHDKEIKLYNWKNKRVESIKKEMVMQHQGKFYEYILKNLNNIILLS